MDKDNRVYEYDYSQYIGKQYSVIVMNDGTVILSETMPVSEEDITVTISKDAVDLIRSAIKDHPEVFGIREEIHPNGIILDGAYQTFRLNDGERQREIRVNNIDFCEDIKDAVQIAELHEEIAGILIGQGIDEKYLLLDPYEEEEEAR